MTDTLTLDQQHTAEVARLNILARRRQLPGVKYSHTHALHEHLHGDDPDPATRTATFAANALRLAQIVAAAPIDPENDPWKEGDFGVVEMDSIKIYWKIDYYSDLTRNWGSEAPWDDTQTVRQLTMMLPSDY